MTGPGVPEDDMPHLLWRPKMGVRPVDDAALDALLASDRRQEEADGPLGPVAEVMAALRASPGPAELAGLDRALAEFRKADGRATAPRRFGPARPARRRARLFAQLGAAAIVLMAGVFGTAAYADVLPPALQGFAHRAFAAPAPVVRKSPATRSHPAGPAGSTTIDPGSSQQPGRERGRHGTTHPPGRPSPLPPGQSKGQLPGHQKPTPHKPKPPKPTPKPKPTHTKQKPPARQKTKKPKPPR